MTKDKMFAATMVFHDPIGDRHEQVVFGADLAKLVKLMVNYATQLSFASYHVYGSMVEDIDHYWEGSTADLKEVPVESTLH